MPPPRAVGSLAPAALDASRFRRRASRPSRSPRDADRRLPRRRRAVSSDASADDAAPSSSSSLSPLLDNVCFVLCRPQGPQNIGAIARVMNNFGVTDLRIVTPEASALAPPFDARDADDRPHHPAAARAAAPLADEARAFAVHADWLLRDAKRCATADEALEDVVFVAATTARPRENLPVVDAREAASRVADAAKRGRVAVVFGNEATGLTNDELRRANLGVMIPTAGHEEMRASARRRSKQKYTGGAGPTSLNLSHAVGVLAYELHSRFRDAEVRGFGSGLVTVGERKRLAEELASARFAMEVLRPRRQPRGGASDDGVVEEPEPEPEPESGPSRGRGGEEKGPRPRVEEDGNALSGDGGGGGGGGGDGGGSGCFVYSESDRLAEEKESRAIANVLNAGPIASRDAAALFALARRAKDWARHSGTEAAALAAAAALFEEAEAEGRPTPGAKAVGKRVRERCGVSLTAREMERVARETERRMREATGGGRDAD